MTAEKRKRFFHFRFRTTQSTVCSMMLQTQRSVEVECKLKRWVTAVRALAGNFLRHALWGFIMFA